MNDKKPVTAPDILRAGVEHMKARAGTYDSSAGERSMAKAVDMFNACHGTALTEEQGWHLLELVKHVRFFSAPGYHADSVEDGCAYGALRGEAKARADVVANEAPSQGEPGQLVTINIEAPKELDVIRAKLLELEEIVGRFRGC